MKKQLKTLSLKKETIATLNNKQMSKVVGGITTIKPTNTWIAAPNTLETTDAGYITIKTTETI